MEEERSAYGFSAEDRKLLKKLRKEAKPKHETAVWDDLPPILEELPEGILDNGNLAKVGQSYSVYTNKTHKVHCDSEDDKTLPWYSEDIETENPSHEDTIRTVHGIEIWSVIQPIQIKQVESIEPDIRKQLSKDAHAPTAQERELHDKEVKAWREKKLCDKIDKSVQSLPKLPNGKYWSERWLAKINDENGQWRPALKSECEHWYSIPESKRRVDYLEGVIPDE